MPFTCPDSLEQRSWALAWVVAHLDFDGARVPPLAPSAQMLRDGARTHTDEPHPLVTDEAQGHDEADTGGGTSASVAMVSISR